MKNYNHKRNSSIKKECDLKNSKIITWKHLAGCKLVLTIKYNADRNINMLKA